MMKQLIQPPLKIKTKTVVHATKGNPQRKGPSSEELNEAKKKESITFIENS